MNLISRRTNGIHELNRLWHRSWLEDKAKTPAESEVLHGNQLLEESKQMKPAFTITKKTNH